MSIITSSLSSSAIIKEGVYGWKAEPTVLAFNSNGFNRHSGIEILKQKHGWVFRIPMPGHSYRDVKLVVQGNVLVVASLLTPEKREVYRIPEKICVPWPAGCKLISQIRASISKGFLIVCVHEAKEIVLNPDQGV